MANVYMLTELKRHFCESDGYIRQENNMLKNYIPIIDKCPCHLY